MLSAGEIQHTRLRGELVFQGFCLKLVRLYWQDDLAQPHGRSGQGQHGADITGRDNRNGYKSAGLQCKASESDEPRQLSVKELVDEVVKAKGYKPALDILIVAYGGDRDATLQRKAQELSAENEANGLFRVEVWSWDDIVERALQFPDIIQELLVHNQVATATTLNPRRPTGSLRPNVDALVQEFVANLQTAVIADEAANTGDPILDAKLDVFRDQLRAGHGPMLVDALRSFVAELPADTKPHTRFRAYSNLGSALLQSDKIEAAIIAYDSAADNEPETADGHTSRARAALLRGDRETGYVEAKLAMNLAPDRFAATLLLEAAPSSESPHTLETEVASFTAEVEVGASLVRLYSDSGAFGDAVRVARNIGKDDWRKDGVLGQALLAQFASDSVLIVGAPMSPEQQLQIDEARVRLERAWTAGRCRPDWKSWTSYAANLASALRLLGHDEEADRLVLEVFALDPTAPSMAQRAALAFMRQGDPEKAQQAVDAAAAGSQLLEDRLLAATIAASRRDWPRVTQLGELALEKAETDDERARAAELLIQAEFRGDAPADALKAATELRGKFAPSIVFESRVAEIARRLGDAKELEAARERLGKFDPSVLNAVAKFELADAYADDGEWSKAADLLHGLHALDRPSEILRRRLFALYRADRRSEARALYESLAAEALESSDILRLGAAVYERSGLLKDALAALAKAIIRDPNDLRSRLDWVRLNVRQGTEGPVRKWIKSAQVPPAGEPEDLLELAQVLDRYGQRKRAMAIGYQTLQAHWGASERLHMMYMSLFLMHPRGEGFLRPKSAGEDSVVFLESERGGVTDYKIEQGGRSGPSVLLPTQPLAVQLTGKKVGESFVPKTGMGQAATWKIVDIKHKYLDLLHRVMEAHNTLFPNSRSFGQFHFDPTKEDRFEPMFEQARERARIVDEAVRIYVTQPMPIDGIARMLGGDAVDASRGLRFQSETVFDSCIGALEERNLALDSILSGSRSFLIDVVTLAFWNEIEFLPELVRLGIKPKVVQATIDALVQRADDARHNVVSKSGSLEARGDQVVFIEVSKADRQAVSDASQSLLEWARANTELVPTDGFEHEILVEAAELLSHSSYDTIATGIASGTLLVVEDRRLRGIAAAAGSTRASWTQPLLMAMRQEGQISDARYVELIARLARQKIGFVSIGAGELGLAGASTADHSDFQALCETLARPNIDVSSLLDVVAGFCVSAWTGGVSGGERLTSEILEQLLCRKEALKIFAAAVLLVERKLKSLPFPDRLIGRLWVKYVERFMVGHFVYEALTAATNTAQPVPSGRRKERRRHKKS